MTEFDQLPEDAYVVPPALAGQYLGGLAAQSVNRLADLGKLPCIRDASSRRLFRMRDLRIERRRREALAR